MPKKKWDGRGKERPNVPAFIFLRPLLTFTEVELIPPHRPLSEEIVTITVFFTLTPNAFKHMEVKHGDLLFNKNKHNLYKIMKL